MFIKEYSEELLLSEEIFNRYKMESIAYFDIETTGFEKDKDFVILISLGILNKKGNITIKQYFAESLYEEAEILYEFGKDLSKFNRWCSYNGMAFDEPFIKRRMEKSNIVFNAPEEHIDLYRLIRPYYKQLGMERCNLKTVEKFIGVERTDKIDGGMSVELYNRFLQEKSEELKRIIMLHNFEDVLNLPKIFKVIYEVENNNNIVREDGITEKQVSFLKYLLKKNEVTLNLDIEKISKKSASRVIDSLLRGDKDIESLTLIINNSY